MQNGINNFLLERVSAVESSLVQATEYQTAKNKYNKKCDEFLSLLTPSQRVLFEAICECNNEVNMRSNEACYLRGFHDVLSLVAGNGLIE